MTTRNPARPCSSPARPNPAGRPQVGWSSVVPHPTGTTTTRESTDDNTKTTTTSSNGTTTGTTWHNPLTITDLLAGVHGQPFTAMCGHHCTPSRPDTRLASDVAPMARCQVCAGLVAGGQRIAL